MHAFHIPFYGKSTGCMAKASLFIVLVSAVWPESSAVAVWNIAVSN
jgi:hypothetical protein